MTGCSLFVLFCLSILIMTQRIKSFAPEEYVWFWSWWAKMLDQKLQIYVDIKGSEKYEVIRGGGQSQHEKDKGHKKERQREGVIIVK